MERIAWESSGDGRNIWATYCTCHCKLTSCTLSDAVQKYVRDTAVRRASHAHMAVADRSHLGWKEKEKREKKERRRRGGETGGGKKVRHGKTQWIFSPKGWCIAASQCNESLEKQPLLLFMSQIWFKWRQKGQDAVGNGKEGRKGKVQRERDSQSTEFLQALSDPHNQQGSSWQQGI